MKRMFDIIIGSTALALLGLPLLVLAALVRWKMGSPVLFRQVRPGRNGKPFEIIKFRTMTAAHGNDGSLLPDMARLTPLGSVMRKSSLDELPELWNVLKGDMSLVGPRPLLMEYLPLYSAEQARRHEMAPGITGWAQVNGRNSLTWEEKFKLDIWYVDHWSLLLDIAILWKTACQLLSRKGIDASRRETMPIFTGTQSRVEKTKAHIS